MLSQTFFVKVDPSLQAKVPLHPGCIYTFEPVTETGPYDERNKSYLKLVENTAGPPGGDGIFRVIASRGVVTIQRDEYTPVALNSFIDRCDPNADVSYGPSGRPFPFEKVTPEPTTNPRHPYALCLKKLKTEPDYFYPGARVELDHIVNVAAGGAGPTPVASPTPTPASTPPVAVAAGGGGTPVAAAVDVSNLPAVLAATTFGAFKTSFGNQTASGTDVTLVQAKQTALDALAGVIRTYDSYVGPALDGTALASIQRYLTAIRDATNASGIPDSAADIDTEMSGLVNAELTEKQGKIAAIRAAVGSAETIAVDDPYKTLGDGVRDMADGKALDSDAADEYIKDFKGAIVTALRAAGANVFGSNDSTKGVRLLSKSIKAYTDNNVFVSTPTLSTVDDQYTEVAGPITTALGQTNDALTAVWNATKGRCNTDTVDFVPLGAGSLNARPRAFSAAEQTMDGIAQKCNYTALGPTFFSALGDNNQKALNAMALAKALNDNPYAMFAMPDGFRTTINTFISQRVKLEFKGSNSAETAANKAALNANVVGVYGGWTQKGTTAKVKGDFVLDGLPGVPGVTA
jgi:hypothetical protein